MDGVLLLSDGTKLEGMLSGDTAPVTGWLTANTSIVGFPQMLTDPSYRNVLLAFTYPEIGGAGAAGASLESGDVQPRGVIVRELCPYPSHYSSEEALTDMLSRTETVCLSGVDTRGLAVHLRRKGEMPAVIAPQGIDEQKLLEELQRAERPVWEAGQSRREGAGKDGPAVAVIDLGMRGSFFSQLRRTCRPAVLPFNASPEMVEEQKPDAVIVTDGPGLNYPPEQTVETLKNITGSFPLFACGLGCIALGLAAGCRAEFFHRGHHGANYPVRDLQTGKVETTHQRHSIVLNGDSVEESRNVETAFVNLNDGSVEGIRTGDGSATGYQPLLSPFGRDGVNRHILDFVDSL